MIIPTAFVNIDHANDFTLQTADAIVIEPINESSLNAVALNNKAWQLRFNTESINSMNTIELSFEEKEMIALEDDDEVEELRMRVCEV